MARKKTPFGFPAMAGGGGALSLPTTRKPTRAALGGMVPRGGRTRVAPAVGVVGARGGGMTAKAPTPRKRTTTTTRRKKTA